MDASTEIARTMRGCAHGTRARYVAGCRCDACRDANNARDRDRRVRVKAAASEIKPSGPVILSTMRRGGRDVRVRRCPGANGAPCVREAAWLRGSHDVCAACVERATVWNGRVPVARAREHLRHLRARGVGYPAVAAACDIAESVMGRILADQGTIRADTERRILAVDERALADGARVDAATMNARVAAMRARGFTLRHLAKLLGYKASLLRLGGRAMCNAATAARVERLFRRVERGEITPQRSLVRVEPERAWLAELMDRGVTAQWLSERLGFLVTRSRRAAPMHAENVAKVRAFRAELETLVREGDGLPEDWQFPPSALRSLAEGFGFEGGWMVRGRARVRSAS